MRTCWVLSHAHTYIEIDIEWLHTNNNMTAYEWPSRMDEYRYEQQQIIVIIKIR